eukprot:TRINITY_DN1351_c1_g2_i4.p2 TRINITY_DN1351_c1_g2~~TRINITY_DN1351_c1_g2_i4.p2  ORF type:complete len:105 (-),score=24.87 TRINITY_DN1351_c1_g2_i4:431-745(-)
MVFFFIVVFFFFFLMIRRPPRSTHCISSAASDVYKRQVSTQSTWVSVRYQEHMVDALAQRGDEGRDYQRYASGSWKQVLIRGFPNGVTRQGQCLVTRKGANPGK